MNRRDIISAIEDPSHLLSMDIEELATAVEDYPCSDVLRMLYLRALQDTEDIRFESELRMTAASVPSREKLYHWLKKESSRVESVAIAPAQSAATHSPKETKEHAPERLPTDTIKAAAAEVLDVESGIVADTQQEAAVAPSDQPRVGSEEQSARSIGLDPLDELERQYLTEAVSVSIGMDADAGVADDESGEMLTAAGSEQEAADNESENSDSGVHESGSFVDFLMGGGRRAFQMGEEEEIDATSDDNVRKTTLPTDELVERFLSNDKREKREFFDPVRMTKASLVDNDELVTETLARVYEHQGNLVKAIRTYESLQLKYPEKRLYFAGRIQRVEDLIDKR